MSLDEFWRVSWTLLTAILFGNISLRSNDCFPIHHQNFLFQANPSFSPLPSHHLFSITVLSKGRHVDRNQETDAKRRMLWAERPQNILHCWIFQQFSSIKYLETVLYFTTTLKKKFHYGKVFFSSVSPKNKKKTQIFPNSENLLSNNVLLICICVFVCLYVYMCVWAISNNFSNNFPKFCCH